MKLYIDGDALPNILKPILLRAIDKNKIETIVVSNKKITIGKALNKNAKIKNPKLDETCLFYGIDFDPNAYHSATYDVSKTYIISSSSLISISHITDTPYS